MSEVAETTEAPAEATGDSAAEAPAATAETASEEAAPAEAASSEDASTEAPAEDAPPVFDWNGEVDNLRQSDWLQSVPSNVRSALLRGVEHKYRNWQRGYTDKFQELSGQRKMLDKREQDIRTQESRVQKWLHGDIDPLEDKQREIDELKSAHNAALQTLREEYAENVEKSKTASTTEYETLKTERDELQRLHQATLDAKVAAAEAELESKVDDFETWLKEEAPDVLENDQAFYALCVNCKAGFEKELALEMVRGKWPAPAPTPEAPASKPEPIPEGMKLMNMGTGLAAGTDASDVRSYDDIMNQMRRAAQHDEAAFLRTGNDR